MLSLALIGEQIEPFLSSYGSIVLMLMVFAGCGLTTGFLLPGDSALFIAGILAARGVLANVWLLSAGCFAVAVLGYQIGYLTGRRLGPALFRRPDAVVFRPSRLREAEYFYFRRGTAAVIAARWLPVARTFAPIVAGATRMETRAFTRANLIGAGLWCVGLIQGGYWLGQVWPELGDRLEVVTAVIVLISLAPVVIHTLTRRRRRSHDLDLDLDFSDSLSAPGSGG